MEQQQQFLRNLLPIHFDFQIFVKTTTSLQFATVLISFQSSSFCPPPSVPSCFVSCDKTQRKGIATYSCVRLLIDWCDCVLVHAVVQHYHHHSLRKQKKDKT